jgi:hypothetical protein
MTSANGETVKAFYVADVLPGGSADHGRYVIVGLKLAGADGDPQVTHVAFKADQFDRFLMQLLDNAARARSDRLKHNPPPEDAILNMEQTALPVVNASAELSVMREGRTLICLKMDPGNWDRRLASLHFSFDEESLEQLSETVQHALATLHAPTRGWLKAAN